MKINEVQDSLNFENEGGSQDKFEQDQEKSQSESSLVRKKKVKPPKTKTKQQIS